MTRIERADRQRVAHLTELGVGEPKSRLVMVDDLGVVAEFRDLTYPGLVETGRVEPGGDKPFHTVINSENCHALEPGSGMSTRLISAKFVGASITPSPLVTTTLGWVRVCRLA